MNKTNGVIEEAGASTSLYNQEPSPPITKRQSVGFPSFLKLFKKNERDNRKSIHLTNGESSKPKIISVTQRNLKDNNNHINGKYNSNETLSPPSSPILGHLSPSSSCDSVLSTATTGFAFIPPSNYQFGNSVLLNKSILFEPDTDTYKARLRKQKHLSEQDKRLELTLRKKYQLYDADTLKSNKAVVGHYDNIQYADRSLPHIKHKDINEDPTTNERKKHRRTASDSSKDKKSGQYVHVKGKRKAPPPPPPPSESALTNGIAENQEDYDQRQYRTLPNTSTIGSTLGRKKRKAPPPPPALSPTFEASSKSILAEGLFDDKEIKALIEGTNSVPSTSHSEDKDNEMKESPLASKDCEETNAARRLTEQQKQILIDNIVKSHVPTDFKNRMSQIISSPVQSNEINQKEFSPQPTPVSPISPRPWYKRPMSSNRDSAIPFKREIVLKTMEKRKSKYKDKDKDSKTPNALGDPPPSRSSIFDAGHKFGFFSRNKDSDVKEKEKRRSGIGIPNISELDREAAEIVNRENANCRAKKQAENDKFFSPPEHLILQQQMFGSTMSSECSENSADATPKVTSTKDLISKFEASTSNVTRITLNTSFIGRTENFVGAKSPEPPSPIAVETKTPPSLAEVKDSTKPVNNYVKPDSKAEAANNISKILWTCPFCTLVNPNWRIICEACECIKPYGKEANPVKPSKIDLQPKETKPDSKPKPEPVKQEIKSEVKPKKPEQNDWEKKAEKVMKYFMPRTTGNALSKSSSETTVNKKMAYFRKSPSPSKLPVSTSKLDMQLKQYKNEQIEISKSQNPIPKIPEEKEATTPNSPLAETKKELLDSSAIVTTVTPVFYAQTAFNKNAVPRKNISRSQEAINIEEIRSARLAKFSKKHPTPAIDTRSRESISLEDHDSLEREKKRLREMIRRMNAKALAEKYPVLNKNASTTDLPTRIERTPPEQQPEIKIGETQEANKLGAIKKMFTKTSSTEKPLDEPVNNFSKPKKVSSSAQTTGIVKLPDVGRKQSPDKNNKHEDNSYAYILKPDKNNSKMKEKNIFAFNEPVELRKPQPKLSDYDHFKVQEISQQLISVQGRNEFKETLRNPFREMSRTDTIALNKIMRNLELAIAEGQDEMAAQIAMDLAKMKITLHVTKQRNEKTVDNNPNKSIIVDISVEDRVSKKGPIQITVMPLLTVTELKEKMFMDFGIPIEVQKWTINNQSVLDDKKTLLQYGVKDKAAMMNLYLADTSPQVKEEKKNNLEIPATSIAVQEDIDDELSSNGSSISHNDVIDQEEVHGAAALPVVTQAFLKSDITPKNDSSWTCPLCTLINLSYRLDCIACCTKRPISYKAKEQPISKLSNFVIPDELKRFLSGETMPYKPEEAKNDLNKATANRKSSEIFNIVVPSEPKKPAREKLNVSPAKTGEPPQPQLPIFSSNVTKLKYRGVDNYNPNRKDPAVAATGTAGRRYNKKNPAPPVPKQPTTTHYQELLSLDTSDYVPNVEEFDCPICLVKFETGEGVILRDCLHTFCKDCIKNTVQYSDEAEVKCPYMDNDYSCDSVLQEREIKSIVTREIYELHLAKSVRVAEHQIENAFHCKTPNCRGWCIYEDNVNQFKCPVCKITNCLTCRVIHDGLTCKQYQDRLNSDCDSNQEARRTKEMLNDMVEKGEAMNCPTCQVVMMKKWGCDWLKCSMCKTEICWVTRGPRWGPGGKGDTTAGCKCGVEGKKCHPKCNYCH